MYRGILEVLHFVRVFEQKALNNLFSRFQRRLSSLFLKKKCYLSKGIYLEHTFH